MEVNLNELQIDDFELSVKMRCGLLVQEIANLEAEMYQMEIRHKVRARLGQKDTVKAIEALMEGLQAAIDELKGEYKVLSAELHGENDEDGSAVD